MVTNRDKVIDLKIQIPLKKEMPRQEDMSHKVVGLHAGADKIFFPHEVSIKVYLSNHLVLEFVHQTHVRCLMHRLSCLYEADVPRVLIKGFFEDRKGNSLGVVVDEIDGTDESDDAGTTGRLLPAEAGHHDLVPDSNLGSLGDDGDGLRQPRRHLRDVDLAVVDASHGRPQNR